MILKLLLNKNEPVKLCLVPFPTTQKENQSAIIRRLAEDPATVLVAAACVLTLIRGTQEEEHWRLWHRKFTLAMQQKNMFPRNRPTLTAFQ